jgi:hypothetical protein
MPKKPCDFVKKVDGLRFHAGFRKFKIEVIENLLEGGTECWGSTDFDLGTIYLRANADHDTARETLIHEITHVILAVSGLGGYDADEMGGEFTDGYIAPTNNEHLTLCVSRGFMSAFNLNKELFEVLLEEGE